MTNAEIREFKSFVVQVLTEQYNMPEVLAHRAVRDSYLSKALNKDKDYVMHDTVEYWAEFVFDELNQEHKLRM